MAPTARQIESLRAIGAEIITLEIKGIPKLKYFQKLPSLRKYIPSVDLLHAHYGYCGWFARCQYSKPVVVSFMGDDLLGTRDDEGRIEPFSRLMVQTNRWLARIVDAVIVKSTEMAKVVAPLKAHIVPNGVDLRIFRPMDRHAARALLGWDGNRHRILFPGNPDNPQKGFRLAQTVVINASKRLAEPLELVALWGVATDQVPLYMNSCEAMLVTSFSEGSPNVVKEAMACNLPVVSVPVGDVPELFKGVPGYTICPRDTDLLGETDGRAALAHKGLALESVAWKIMDIYEAILTRGI
jgi:glycosyltransferase involved in cell wall biosynthesis